MLFLKGKLDCDIPYLIWVPLPVTRMHRIAYSTPALTVQEWSEAGQTARGDGLHVLAPRSRNGPNSPITSNLGTNLQNRIKSTPITTLQAHFVIVF